MNTRWQLTRAGLLNFWYYDEEEFHFADGKLLLRGTNGSGKSVTMQSLIPVLLDGRKSPDRLDPFGSRARKMEDYLLGEKEVTDLDERTGYLYLEYGRPGTKQYLTTGIGLKARRQGQLDFWGFVILDNRRVGHELPLYKMGRTPEGKREKIPLTRRELENEIGEGGHVVRTQNEYMELVNRHVFGFKSLDDFDDLMKLLIQLRSPKLSKDFRPTVIYEILNSSLPALADDELRTLSETIENMDQTKNQLDQLLREEQSLKRLLKPYDLYNQKVFLEKAEGMVNAHQRLASVERKVGELQAAFQQTDEDMAALRRTEESLRREKDVLEREQEALKEHDAFKAEQEKEKLSEKLVQVNSSLRDKHTALEGKKGQEQGIREQIQRGEQQEYQAEQAVKNCLDELDGLAEEAVFLNHDVAAAEFQERQAGHFSFALWKKESKDYEARLEQVLSVLRDEGAAKEKYQEAENALGDARKSYDEAQYQEKKWQDLLQEEREQWLARFFAWHENNAELHFEDHELQATSQRALGYPEEASRDVLREPLLAARDRIKDKIRKEILNRDHAISLSREKIKETQGEIDAWQRKKDPEPPRDPLTEEARQALQAQSIPLLPFYAAVEFHDHVSPEVRERLESALREMGILDGLIIPESFQASARGSLSIVHDRVLQARPQILAHTLAEYLYPIPSGGVSAAEIDGVLRTIIVEDGPRAGLAGDTALSAAGAYHIGNVLGHAPQKDTSVYIGKESRRQYRLREIERLEAEIARLREEIQVVEQDKALWQEKLAQLEREYEGFPSDQGMCEAHGLLDDARRDVRMWEQEVSRKNLKVKETLDKWQTLKARLRELSKTISLELRESVYVDAVQAMKRYRDYLTELELGRHKAEAARSEVRSNRMRLDDMMETVDALKGDVNILEGELDSLKRQLKLVEQRLRDLGAEEIRRQIELVIGRLSVLPGEIEDKVRRLAGLGKDQEQRAESLQKHAREQGVYLEWVKGWSEVFQDEERLQEGFQETPVSSATREGLEAHGPGESILKRAQMAVARLKTGSSSRSSAESSDREVLRDRLNDVFYKEMSVLVEYRLTQQTIFDREIPEPPTEMEDANLWESLWEELKGKARRLQVVMEYDGKRVSPSHVLRQLEQNISLQRQLLNEKDRELYEEIIMNSVGRVIRGRIQRAEHWVEEINKLMAERDTSSGLKFAIRWKPRTAEHEEEMDTKELVDLLKSDSRLLKDSDMNRMTAHFRVKIERAKQELEIKGHGESFHQIIKEMLDYRQWFAFTLYYQIEGGPWKELTDRAFYKFSGGEKAMAMYIPLFSAAYSRYSDAKPDAPRIISLDEAFAGVDENNIRDMFDLLEKLGFNYIMNSQALWGDYDTVANLAIAELVRPKNASYVTVIRYAWNGRVKKLWTGTAEG